MWFTLASLSYLFILCLHWIIYFSILLHMQHFWKWGINQVSPRTVFCCAAAGSVIRNASGPHFRCVVTTPTWLCPGGGRGVAALRGRMEVSLSVLLDSGHNKDRSMVVPGLTPVPYSLPHQCLQIIISAGSISTDRGATSSSSSTDQGPWFADRLEKASGYSGRKKMRVKDGNNNLLYTQTNIQDIQFNLVEFL